MVLQRGRRNALWGWDRPGETLVVRVVRVDGQREPVTLYAKASQHGEFRVELPELEPGATHRIQVHGSSEVTIDDVLVGEVWLASGQSNMEWTVAQSDRARETIAGATDPQIRWLRVARRPSLVPASRVDASWLVVDPSNVEGLTAVGYAFARGLRERLGVPVGIVDASWGGTPIEAWTSIDALRSLDPDVDERLASLDAGPDDLARLQAEHAAAILRWERETLPRDPGNRGEPAGWASPSFDASSWPSMRVPEYWQRQNLDFNGAVWFRRTVTVPPAWEGKDLVLELGAVDDFDRTYFNGEVVGEHPQGTPGAYQIRRSYRVPARLARPGENVVAVRVFDHAGQGGFAGPASAMGLSLEGRREHAIPLDGPWHYAVEHAIARVPSTVWATFPQAPAALTPQYTPAALYGGMIHPLLPCGMGGILWYQGESNVVTHPAYLAHLIALIRDWRTRFRQGQIPFYLVQLASFAATPEWAKLREAQAQARSEPATDMVTTIDIGDPMDIHPANKHEVGRRLAALALAEHFGFRDVIAHGPRLLRVEMGAGAVRVAFAHAAGLRTTDGGALVRGFQVAGDDLVFHEAEGRIEGESVVVTAPAVPTPAAVRYAFSDCPPINLVNAAGLPAEPFRTDCE
jgi:sialate O-acetylesterase